MHSNERRDMDSRLMNWSNWCKTWGGYPSGSSQTGLTCDRMRRAAGAVRHSDADRRMVDRSDAVLLEQVMGQLKTEHRILLWRWYIRRENREVVCRMMRIPHRPLSELEGRLAEARAAVEALSNTVVNTVRNTV